MKEVREIVTCTVPFILAAMLVYPFMAIVGADFDPFMWERTDRMFYAICTGLFGWALFIRVDYARKEPM